MPGPDLTPTAATIEAYLTEVAGRLRGPRRFRARVLDELRDGLWEAADLHAGRSPGHAATRAIAEFGPAAQLAAAFTQEAAAAQARHTVIAYAVTGPLVGVWWLLTLAPPSRWPAEFDVAALMAALPALPVIVLAVLAIGLTLATTGRLSRRFPTRRAVELSLATAVACALADLTMLGALAAGGSASFAGLPLLAGTAVAASLTRLAITAGALHGGWRTRSMLT